MPLDKPQRLGRHDDMPQAQCIAELKKQSALGSYRKLRRRRNYSTYRQVGFRKARPKACLEMLLLHKRSQAACALCAETVERPSTV